MSGGAAKTKAKMEALEEEKRKAKEREREAAGNANVWIEQDMTGKPIEVVIEYGKYQYWEKNGYQFLFCSHL